MQTPTEPDSKAEIRIAADPRYAALVRDRQRFSWTLTAITVAIYSAFISLIAFDKPLLCNRMGVRAMQDTATGHTGSTAADPSTVDFNEVRNDAAGRRA